MFIDSFPFVKFHLFATMKSQIRQDRGFDRVCTYTRDLSFISPSPFPNVSYQALYSSSYSSLVADCFSLLLWLQHLKVYSLPPSSFSGFYSFHFDQYRGSVAASNNLQHAKFQVDFDAFSWNYTPKVESGQARTYPLVLSKVYLCFMSESCAQEFMDVYQEQTSLIDSLSWFHSWHSFLNRSRSSWIYKHSEKQCFFLVPLPNLACWARGHLIFPNSSNLLSNFDWWIDNCHIHFHLCQEVGEVARY